MNYLTITFTVWVSALILKALGFPLVKELTWGQLFLVPVVVFLARASVVLISILAFLLALWFCFWITGWLPANVALPTGY